MLLINAFLCQDSSYIEKNRVLMLGRLPVERLGQTSVQIFNFEVKTTYKIAFFKFVAFSSYRVHVHANRHRPADSQLADGFSLVPTVCGLTKLRVARGSYLWTVEF
ncbi:hypothetical protein AVEN_20998-1 [Araneus ventricosus]|uniref:Uncharacterized protein n=1 Tax=Araneus ventricosus TaxID=182803 RepID=A0A4Y2D7U5_ARAVE|nr:hypothetical protein AVEN_20998-1 [Araneus ventricosus]